MARSFEKLVSGKYVTHYNGTAILVGRTEKGDWLAETAKTEIHPVTKTRRYVPETNYKRHIYDHNTTRKAAVEMVIYLMEN